MTPLHDTAVRGFASDNYSGVHPEVLAAIAAANEGHQIAYGEDRYTTRLQEVFRTHLGEGVEAYPVFNGTGANVVGLQSMLPRWGAVIAASTAHINVDEGGAPEKVAGVKILNVPTDDGKLTADLIDLEAWGWGDEHRSQPLAVSITQSTELGTLYTPDEVRAIADHAHSHGMRLHMDGARIANAAAALDVPLRAFTRDSGVDVLSFGGTKNGCWCAEAIVFMNPDQARDMPFIRKRAAHLFSKTRFISAQFDAYLDGGLWLDLARLEIRRDVAHENLVRVLAQLREQAQQLLLQLVIAGVPLVHVRELPHARLSGSLALAVHLTTRRVRRESGPHPGL